MTGFRSLGEDEIVDFEAKESDKGVEATLVTGPNSANLRGSSYQRNNKKRYRKTRYIIDFCLIFSFNNFSCHSIYSFFFVLFEFQMLQLW